MAKRKMIISTKQCGAYTTHCQLHGEPTEHPAYTHCKFVIDGQKVRHFNLHEGAMNIQVLEAMILMELNIDDFDYQFVRWENFNLLNKALVMPALPTDEDIMKWSKEYSEDDIEVQAQFRVMAKFMRLCMKGNGA